MGAAFPYAAEESSRLLGFTPMSFCAPEMALDLAMAAFMRAARGSTTRAVGIGLTAAVASREARRGESRAYAAYFGDAGAGVAEAGSAAVRQGRRSSAPVGAATTAAATAEASASKPGSNGAGKHSRRSSSSISDARVCPAAASSSTSAASTGTTISIEVGGRTRTLLDVRALVDRGRLELYELTVGG